jgi:hypothetical protein
LPLSEKARIEVYLPDVPRQAYQDLLGALEQELRYVDEQRDAALEALEEEAVLVVVFKVYHAAAQLHQ